MGIILIKNIKNMVTFNNTNFIDSEDLIHGSLTRTSILNTILKMYPEETLKEYSFTGGYFSLFNLLNMISKEEKIDINITEYDVEIIMEFKKDNFNLTRVGIKDEFVSETKERFYDLIDKTIDELVCLDKIFTKPIDSKLLKDHYPPGTKFVVTKVSMNGDKWVKRRFDKNWYFVKSEDLDKEDNILLTVNAYGRL